MLSADLIFIYVTRIVVKRQLGLVKIWTLCWIAIKNTGALCILLTEGRETPVTPTLYEEPIIFKYTLHYISDWTEAISTLTSKKSVLFFHLQMYLQ